MNTKAVTLSFLMALIIGVFVLFIIYAFIIPFFTGGPILFANLLPDFTKVKKGVEGIEILRYNIAADEVEYYNGQKGVQFKGKDLILGDKKLLYDVVLNDIHKALLSEEKVITLSREARDIFYKGENAEFVAGMPFLDAVVVYFVTGTYDAYKGGDVKIRLLNKQLSKDVDYGEFVLGFDNTLKFRKVESVGGRYTFKKKYEVGMLPNTGDYALIKEGARAWRENIFKKPIVIHFTNERDKKPDSMSVCMTRVQNYLRIDLLALGENCGGSNG